MESNTCSPETGWPQGRCPEGLLALSAAVDQFAGVFTSMGGLMAERVTDLRDIERRVTARLVGEPEPGVPVPDAPSVLLAPPGRSRRIRRRCCSST